MSGEKYCLQCGAPLILKSVAADPVYPYGPHVTACSACGSRSYDVLGNKIKELTGQRDELLAALKAFEALEDESRKVWESSGIVLEKDFAQKSWEAWSLLHSAIAKIEAAR